MFDEKEHKVISTSGGFVRRILVPHWMEVLTGILVPHWMEVLTGILVGISIVHLTIR